MEWRDRLERDVAEGSPWTGTLEPKATNCFP